MTEKIKRYLADIEKEKEIKILLACETGSRAWGFPSPDSDYDVRIIYKHKKDWYLSLFEEKDSIELMLDNNEIDISGWDLRKSLRLLWKSNPPILERIQSPIIYQVDNNFIRGINKVAKETYSRITAIHHYLSMGKKAFEEVSNNEKYKLKKFFYALRASVACLWILEREEIPPIEFGKMIDGLDIAPNLTERIYGLIKLKSTISESYLHTEEKELIQFMIHCLNRAENEAKSLPASNGKINDLNVFFRKILED